MHAPLQSDSLASSRETITLLDGRVRLRIPRNQGLKPSMDTVLLAASVPARAGERVLDAGCGVGSAGLCVRTRVGPIDLVGIDRAELLIDYARENAILNNAAESTVFQCADLFDPVLKPLYQDFDHVLCNPPYMDRHERSPSPDPLREQALGSQGRHDTIEQWCGVLGLFIKPRGTLTLIQRADRIDRMLQALAPLFGAIDIIPLWPRAGLAARRVVIRAIKGRATPATLHAGLVLHEADGAYTQSAEAILRTGHGLFTEREKTAAANTQPPP